jgi:serine/threonine protein kinase
VLTSGTTLGPYTITGLLGTGGMGEVYRAVDTRLDREVAIKVLPPKLAEEPSSLERFRREAKAVAALSHPNIVAIFDVGSDNGVHYAVTELLEGETLRTRLARGPLTADESLRILLDIAEGVAAAHSRDIIHRDLKPENVFITTNGRVKVLDFGLARADSSASALHTTAVHATEPGIIMGTVGYLAPEQAAARPLTKATDIFALGCIWFEVLTNRVPFEGLSTALVLAALMRDPAPHLPETDDPLNGAIDALIQKCLSKVPADRFQDGGALAAAIRGLLTDDTEILRLSASMRRAMHRKRPWFLAFPILIALLIGAALFVRHQNEQVDNGYDLRVSDIRGNSETRRLITIALRADAEGNRAKAMELLEQAHRQSQESGLAAGFLASFNDAASNAQSADYWSAEARKRLRPDTPVYESMLIRYLAEPREEEHSHELALAQAIINLRPAAWRFRLAAAHMLLSQRDGAAALRQLKMIDIEKPDDRRLMLVLADRASLGDINGAAHDLQRSRLMAKPVFSAYTLARIAWTRGDVASAISNYDACAERAAADNLTALELDARVYQSMAQIERNELAAAQHTLGLAAARARQMNSPQREFETAAVMAYAANREGDAEDRDRRLNEAQALGNHAGDLAALRVLAIRMRSEVWKSWKKPDVSKEPLLTGVAALMDAREAWYAGNLDAARAALRRARAEAIDGTGMREEAELLSAELRLPSTLLKADPPYPNILRWLAIFDLARMRVVS